MARKEITTPLDLKNLDNHNYNYDELYGLIDETDRRISEDMWEEIKGANTMKMLEPVQRAADLPREAADKSLITVIDEQRVYGFVNGEWQPFNQIDLDPFEPFKDELAEIVSAYESKIQSITQEVQSTKDSAIDSIESTQSQSESNIENIKQTAINSVNKAQQEAESNIGAIRDEMTTQASDLTALFNDSMDKLTSKQDTALAEVDSAKQAAITELENFQNTDTSNWQKYKLTTDDGAHGAIGLNSDYEALHALEPGFHYTTNTPIDLPVSSTAGFTEVSIRSDYDNLKHIRFRPYNSNQEFVKRYYNEWYEWEFVSGSFDDTGWVPFDLINGAVGDTAFKHSGDNGFNCAYRIIEKDGVSEKRLRINAKNIVHRQIIAQLPEGFAKNLQYHFVRVPADLGLNGMIGIYPNGKIYIYVNSDKQAEWESRSGDDVYFYGEVNWVD
ncbi:hypothetical protein [Staphylococcus cohnii]